MEAKGPDLIAKAIIALSILTLIVIYFAKWHDDAAALMFTIALVALSTAIFKPPAAP